jgi:hypothetical protein
MLHIVGVWFTTYRERQTDDDNTVVHNMMSERRAGWWHFSFTDGNHESVHMLRHTQAYVGSVVIRSKAGIVPCPAQP